MVPHNWVIGATPMECHLVMLSVTLTQLCYEERIEAPSVQLPGQSQYVFELQDGDTYAARMGDVSCSCFKIISNIFKIDKNLKLP
jgi:hypothetical protein